MDNNFAVFILTHGRPNKVYTYDTIRRQGYTGKIYIVIDNEDKTAEKYYKKFGKENVIMFNKKKVAKTFDEFDNFQDRRSIVYARNACFDIAKDLEIKYFLQLDDDYTDFYYRINQDLQHPRNFYMVKNNLDKIFSALLEYYISIPALTIAASQRGDWFGGKRIFGKPPKRKAMNSFFCSTDRPFKFIGRINEDVNSYTSIQQKGNLFLTIPFVQLTQNQTQSNSGGMTEIYLDNGTYIKSFYTIICAPSCTTINIMGKNQKRLYHAIKWDNAAPCIISETHRKD
jgi:hypothetical protein